MASKLVNHCIRDAEDYKHHHTYIWENPVRAGLSERPELFAWSSASLRTELDAPPPGLKACVRMTISILSPVGTAELSPGRSPGLAYAMEKSRRDD